MTLIANARMYAVTPDVEEAWRAALAGVFDDAGLSSRFTYEAYPAPQPLEVLWRREDLGCVFMCGYPVALRLADVTPIAGPVPDADWSGGRAVYRSDLIVAAESRFQSLEDTFGGTAGWTVEHSHSGFNAFRHHLLAYRTPERPTLYSRVVGHLVTARAILDAVIAGTIDVGPLDAYWHRLIMRSRPDLTRQVRAIAHTATAPLPCFVAGARVPPAEVAALKAAFAGAAGRPWFSGLADPLMIRGFQSVDDADFAVTRALDAAAIAAGYPFPA